MAEKDELKAMCDTGAEGVRDTIQKITRELKYVMERTAFTRLDEIDSSVIWKKN